MIGILEEFEELTHNPWDAWSVARAEVEHRSAQAAQKAMSRAKPGAWAEEKRRQVESGRCRADPADKRLRAVARHLSVLLGRLRDRSALLESDRARSRARREAMGVQAKRDEWNRAQRARRARLADAAKQTTRAT